MDWLIIPTALSFLMAAKLMHDSTKKEVKENISGMLDFLNKTKCNPEDMRKYIECASSLLNSGYDYKIMVWTYPNVWYEIKASKQVLKGKIRDHQKRIYSEAKEYADKANRNRRLEDEARAFSDEIAGCAAWR